MPINNHQKGYRGLVKASELFEDHGLRGVIRWPHSRFNRDFWDFGDVMGFDNELRGWFAQVKNTQGKPSREDFEKFCIAVVEHPLNIRHHSMFIWFPNRKQPKIWKLNNDSELVQVTEEEAFNGK